MISSDDYIKMMDCVNKASCDGCPLQDYCFNNKNKSFNPCDDDSPCYGCLDDCRLCELNFLSR